MHADEIKAEAVRETGLDDFGEDHFEIPLALWAEGLAAPGLTDFGRKFLARQAVADLARRLRVVELWRRHPEIEAVKLPPILYISGHERSGTTLLHNLLMSHPKARALLRWELMRPTPPPEAATYRTDPRIAKTQKAQDRLRGSLLERMHWVNATDPEECVFGFLNASGIMGGSPIAAMPDWGRWLGREQPEAAFRDHRRLIQLLLWRNPPPEGGHLVLKAPQIANQLPLWRKVFPEARIILLHRDPYRMCTSVATLMAHVNQAFVANDLSDPKAGMGAFSAELTTFKCASLTAYDRAAEAAPVNIAYPDLIADPVGAARLAHSALGADDWPEAEEAIERYLASQTRARPPAEMPSFGLDHDAFLARPVIAAYCARFGLTAERRRLSG